MKKFLIASLVVVGLLISLFYLTGASAQVKKTWPVGIPFEDLFAMVWSAIEDLRDQIKKIVPGKQLYLVDAKGQDLGILIHSDRNGTAEIRHRVFLRTPEAIIEVREYGINFGVFPKSARVNSLGDKFYEDVIFTGPNCTGTPFFVYPIDQYGLIKASDYRYFVFAGAINPLMGESRLNNTGCANFSKQSYQNTFHLKEITLPFSEPLAWPLKIINK